MHGLKLNYLHCFYCCYLAFIKHSLCTKRGWNISKNLNLQKKASKYLYVIYREIHMCCVWGCMWVFQIFHYSMSWSDGNIRFQITVSSTSKSCQLHLKCLRLGEVCNLTPELWTAIPEGRTLLPAGNHLMPWSMRSDYPYHHLSLHRYRCY